MKCAYIWIAILLIFSSCSSISITPETKYAYPNLATVGQQDKSLLSRQFISSGAPEITSSIAVSFNSYPFTKSRFADYEKAMRAQGKTPKVVYVDTMENKPQYAVFRIKDFVGLQVLINQEENEGLRTYLATDQNQELVYEIHALLPGNILEGDLEGIQFELLQVEGKRTLRAIHGKNTSEVPMESLQIFDFESTNFCWTKDARGQLQVAAINIDGGRCPGNATNNPQELLKPSNYLKY